MSETLWAVIIGGIIAIAATIPPLIYSHYRWKKEKKLEHLMAKRKDTLEQYMLVLNKLPDYIQGEGDWDWNMASLICLGLTEEITKEIHDVVEKIKDKKIKEEEVLGIYGLFSTPMRKSLDEIDKKINELMS